jgi:hypothetical protein
MIDPALLVTWLNGVALELEIPFKRGPRQPEFGNGDLLGLVTMLEGSGESLEGIGAGPSFQLRIVGREHQQDALYRSAHAVDAALRFGDYPAELWGTQVVTVNWSGGGPSELLEDEYDRIAYVCTYNVLEAI